MEAGKWPEAATSLSSSLKQQPNGAEARRAAIYLAAVLLLQVGKAVWGFILSCTLFVMP